VADQLFVVLGAGASFDCVSGQAEQYVELSRRPPLVAGLFDWKYRDLVNRYPLARAAAADIRPRLDGETVLLEDILRNELRDSEHHHLRAQYWALPLYFQDLLFESSRRYTQHADNFDRLLNELLRLPRIVFITFNYDTIFDQVLEQYHRLDSLDAYISNPRVVLVKVHGSVNWGRRVASFHEVHDLTAEGYGGLCHALADESARLHGDLRFLARPAAEQSVEALRVQEGSLYYPGLAAPLGPDDELVCPDNHVTALERSLSQQHYNCDFHFLVIGYSCLDSRLLDLIRQSGSAVKSAAFVNGSGERGRRALELLQERIPGVAPREDRDDVEVFDGGLRSFVQGDHLRRLVERIAAA
jgi:hypothetical protein